MGSKSSSSSPVTTSTQTDARQVIDAGGGIVGSGNFWDQSTKLTDSRQTFTDASDRSVSSWWQDSSNRSTNSFTDASNRSTSNSFTDASDRSVSSWWQDNSNRSTSNSFTDSRQTYTDASDRSTTTLNMIDPGALQTAGELGRVQAAEAGRIARDAIEAARSSAAGAAAASVRAQESAVAAMSDSQARAFGLVQSTADMGFQSGRDALGWAGDRFDTIAELTGQVLDASRRNAEGAASAVAGAYTSARDQASGTRTLTIAAIAAVGLVAAFVVLRKN
jgi:hypothetical protein